MAKKSTNKKKTGSKKTKQETQQKAVQKRKNYLFIIPVIIIVCIIGIGWILLNTEVVTSEDVTAQLLIDAGTVQVKHAGVWSAAEHGMYLYQSDSVKTGVDSAASIVLFESSIVRLDSNTEITIQELLDEEGITSVSLEQNAGRTWNTVSKISGIDNYEVQTPTTVASVRGTAFVIIVQPNGTTYYGVDHGVLNVTHVINETIQDFIDVNGNESVIIYGNITGQKITKKPFVIDEWIQENLLKDEQFVGDVKAVLYSRIEPYIPELKAEYGITDQELDVLLDGYIAGDFDLPDDTPQWIRDLLEFT